MKRCLCLVWVAAALLCLGASYRTRNFVASCDDPQVASEVVQAAEAARETTAIAWLGQPLPDWSEPTSIRVRVTGSLGGGATMFNFGGGIPRMSMTVEGRRDKLLSSVIPHETTHSVLATYFRRPLPRWIDEGAAVCAEDQEELRRQDQICRQVLNTPGRMISLRRLLTLTEYPGDVMAFYAEGYSVTSYLISLKDRPTLIRCMATAFDRGWNEALRSTYGFDVDGLERAWLAHLQQTRGGSPPPAGPEKGPVNTPGDGRDGPAAGSLPSGDLALILQTLADTQKIQAEQIRQLGRRVDVLEQRLGQGSQAPPGVLPPSSWNDPLQRTMPTMAPVTPYQPGRFPSPYPNCPPGGT